MNRQLTMNDNFRDIRLFQRIALFVCCFALIAGQARTEESKEQTESEQQAVKEHNPIFPGNARIRKFCFPEKQEKFMSIRHRIKTVFASILLTILSTGTTTGWF